MASYAVIAGNPVAGTGDNDVLALVVTDGERTTVYGTDNVAESLRDDVDWGTGDEVGVLRAGLTGLSYYTVDGPHTFEGDDVREVGPVLARTFGLA